MGKNTNHGRRRLFALVLGLGVLLAPAFPGAATVRAEEAAAAPVQGALTVEAIPGLPEDFVMGMDISSIVAEFNSGVTFKDQAGNTVSTVADFCGLLAENGITHVRVRVWNDPFDGSGNGYGGGNNDVDTAVEIARGCAANGIKLLVDFHCSDFWADPSKQQAPKAWEGYTLEQKAEALQGFLAEALGRIGATGATVDMVQIGNETTGGFVGETDAAAVCTLFAAGSQAVAGYSAATKVVIHVTNPEAGNMTRWAETLADNGVEYDILATSYYPYWHGTLENLKEEMETVRTVYGKDVMVAETSYAYTLEDSDGHGNTVSLGNNDTGGDTPEPFTVQGQATALRNLMAAVHEAGGLGVFYWEPAWITVGDTTGLAGAAYEEQVEKNRALWQANGSGWASSYAAEYDPDDAGQWYGGSAVDNEAQFYPDGTPTDALQVWKAVRTGMVSLYTTVEGIESVTVKAGGETGAEEVLPPSVEVSYNRGKAAEPVTWDAGDLAELDLAKPGSYAVRGWVNFSETVDHGPYEGQTGAEVIATVLVERPNLIADADDAGFEKGDHFAITGAGIDLPAPDDPKEGKSSMHWWSATAASGAATYETAIELEPGQYAFGAFAQGMEGDTVTLRFLTEEGAVLAEGAPCAMTGWADWQTPAAELTLAQAAKVKLQIEVSMQDGGWGTVDCLTLYRTGDAAEAPAAEAVTPAEEPAAAGGRPVAWAFIALAAAGLGYICFKKRRA